MDKIEWCEKVVRANCAYMEALLKKEEELKVLNEKLAKIRKIATDEEYDPMQALRLIRE